MNNDRLIHQVRCLLFISRYSDRAFTADELLTYCELSKSGAEYILDDLCRKNIVEKWEDKRETYYRYIEPRNNPFMDVSETGDMLS